MRTVLHASIDGHEVVTAIGQAVVDPMATQNRINAMVSDLDEWPQIVLLEQQITDRRQQAADQFQSMFGHSPLNLNQANLQAEANYWGKCLGDAQADVDAINSKTVPLRQTLETKRQALWTTNAVYSQPSGGQEELIDDDAGAALETKLAALTDEQRLLLTGDVIPDLRGVKWWSSDLKTATTISKLGDTVPLGGIRDDALTNDQRATIQAAADAARIAAMTPDQKAAELALVLDSLANQAVAMDAKAGITGAALTGKDWYAQQEAAAKAKYA